MRFEKRGDFDHNWKHWSQISVTPCTEGKTSPILIPLLGSSMGETMVGSKRENVVRVGRGEGVGVVVVVVELMRGCDGSVVSENKSSGKRPQWFKIKVWRWVLLLTMLLMMVEKDV